MNAFTENELYLLSEGVLSLIREAGEAAKRVRSEKIIDEISAYRAGLRDLNSKLCRLMRGDWEKAENADPNILVYVSGGLVQGVSCNIPGATCEVFDADAEEHTDEREAYYDTLLTDGNYKAIW